MLDILKSWRVSYLIHNLHQTRYRRLFWISPSRLQADTKSSLLVRYSLTIQGCCATPAHSVSVCGYHIRLINPISPWCRIYAWVNRVSIGSDNGVLLIRRKAIFWTNSGLLSIGPLGTKLCEILIKKQNFWLTKMHSNISSAKMATILSKGRWVKANGPVYCVSNVNVT